MRLVRPDGRAFAFENTVQGLHQEFESGGGGQGLRCRGPRLLTPFIALKTTGSAKVWGAWPPRPPGGVGPAVNL